MYNDFEKFLFKLRHEKKSLADIFRIIRNWSVCDEYTDIKVFGEIFCSLDDLKIPYSKAEICEAFELLDDNDYSPNARDLLLGFFTKTAKDYPVI